VLTNGESIRLSNESLAEFVNKLTNNCSKGTCGDCDLKLDCMNPVDYFNKESIKD
jgi:hypothetical protein